jgi:hypothetical protein
MCIHVHMQECEKEYVDLRVSVSVQECEKESVYVDLCVSVSVQECEKESVYVDLCVSDPKKSVCAYLSVGNLAFMCSTLRQLTNINNIV